MQKARQPITSPIRILVLLLLSAPFRLPAAPDSPDKFSVPSPNGKFIFRQTVEWKSEDGEAAFGVIDARTQRSILNDPGAHLPPMEDSIACLWSPDSRRFAINARVAGRRETTELFEWTGQEFRHIPSIENTITALLAADRNARLKKARIPASSILRPIWDTYTTLKWEDPITLQVLASSTRSYTPDKDPASATKLTSAFTLTLKLQKGAPPKIIAQTTPPSEKSDR